MPLQEESYGVNVQFEESDEETETDAKGRKTDSSVGELNAFGEAMDVADDEDAEV